MMRKVIRSYARGLPQNRSLRVRVISVPAVHDSNRYGPLPMKPCTRSLKCVMPASFAFSGSTSTFFSYRCLGRTAKMFPADPTTMKYVFFQRNRTVCSSTASHDSQSDRYEAALRASIFGFMTRL